MKYKEVLISLLLPILSSCGTSNDSRVKDMVPGSGIAALLGMGYDSHLEAFNSVCADSRFTTPTDRVRYSGAPTASVQMDRSLSYQELKNLLDVQVSGKLNMEGLTVKSAARFASEAASSTLSTSLLFANKLGGRYVILNQPVLTPNAEKVGLTKDYNKIREQCGDQFVEQIELGAELFVAMRFDFANQDVKSAFDAEIDLNFINIFEVSGAAKVAMEKYKNTIGVTVTAYQVGGDVTALGQIFTDRFGDSTGVMRCSIDNINACIEAMQNVVNYATSLQPGNFRDQLKNLTYDDSSPKGAAFLKYVTKIYASGGMRELYETPPPIIAQEIVAARGRLIERYEGQARDRKRVSSFLNMRLSNEERTRFTALDALLGRNINKMVAVGKTCYETPLSCVAAEQAMVLEVYSQDSLTKILDFYDYCVIKRPEWASTSTVAALRSFLGAAESAPCEDLEADLKNELVIDLVGKGISDLRPLSGFSKLTILNLNGNSIRNLDPIARLTSLKRLNLRGNSISNIEQLKMLTNLEFLDLAHNRLVDLSLLPSLSRLKVLKLQGNVFTDSSMLNPASYETLYLNDNQICATERSYALAHGLISDAQFTAYSRANFGPVYSVPGDHNSKLLSFVYCPAVATDY